MSWSYYGKIILRSTEVNSETNTCVQREEDSEGENRHQDNASQMLPSTRKGFFKQILPYEKPVQPTEGEDLAQSETIIDAQASDEEVEIRGPKKRLKQTEEQSTEALIGGAPTEKLIKTLEEERVRQTEPSQVRAKNTSEKRKKPYRGTN